MGGLFDLLCRYIPQPIHQQPTTNHKSTSKHTHTQAHFDRAQQLAPAAAFVYLWRCQLWMCGKLTEESLKKAEAELNK